MTLTITNNQFSGTDFTAQNNAASYDGTRNHPVVLARTVWTQIPDEGARALEPLLVDCSDLTPPGDVDVPREKS